MGALVIGADQIVTPRSLYVLGPIHISRRAFTHRSIECHRDPFDLLETSHIARPQTRTHSHGSVQTLTCERDTPTVVYGPSVATVEARNTTAREPHPGVQHDSQSQGLYPD